MSTQTEADSTNSPEGLSNLHRQEDIPADAQPLPIHFHLSGMKLEQLSNREKLQVSFSKSVITREIRLK